MLEVALLTPNLWISRRETNELFPGATDTDISDYGDKKAQILCSGVGSYPKIGKLRLETMASGSACIQDRK